MCQFDNEFDWVAFHVMLVRNRDIMLLRMMERKGWTADQLASWAGVLPRTIYRIKARIKDI